MRNLKKVLLKASANPLIINKEGKNSLNVSKDEKIKKLLIIHTQVFTIIIIDSYDKAFKI